jgi:hypothetical protein
MAELIFPQLSSGAMAQYPIRKQMSIRTIKNLLADGTMLVAPDRGSQRLVWTLTYLDLPVADLQAIQNHFEACGGAFRGFTFVDPTENLLTFSADLTQAIWITAPGLSVEAGLADPNGGTGAFVLTNAGATTQSISQTLAAPAQFQYCFSMFVSSATSAECTLSRKSANDFQSTICAVGPQWSRISSNGVLRDTGLGLTVSLDLASGQSISVYGPQLEPQFAPSRFRPTFSSAGLYPNAHWAVSELIFTPESPNLFSTSFSIETSLGN